jgi:DNA polymerase-3 subunit epsilon
MPLDFTTIDFETANYHAGSPCAVGLVKVRDGQIVDEFMATFMPPYPHDWFDPNNIKIHGIKKSDVEDGHTWAEILPLMLEFAEGDVLVAHNASFDMGVLKAAAEAIEFELPKIHYGCSLLVSRKVYNLESYRLNAVAYAIGHEEFDHHDALADADACARIMIHAAKRQGAEDLVALLASANQLVKSLN